MATSTVNDPDEKGLGVMLANDSLFINLLTSNPTFQQEVAQRDVPPINQLLQLGFGLTTTGGTGTLSSPLVIALQSLSQLIQVDNVTTFMQTQPNGTVKVSGVQYAPAGFVTFTKVGTNSYQIGLATVQQMIQSAPAATPPASTQTVVPSISVAGGSQPGQPAQLSVNFNPTTVAVPPSQWGYGGANGSGTYTVYRPGPPAGSPAVGTIVYTPGVPTPTPVKVTNNIATGTTWNLTFAQAVPGKSAFVSWNALQDLTPAAWQGLPSASFEAAYASQNWIGILSGVIPVGFRPSSAVKVPCHWNGAANIAIVDDGDSGDANKAVISGNIQGVGMTADGYLQLNPDGTIVLGVGTDFFGWIQCNEETDSFGATPFITLEASAGMYPL